MPNTDTGDDVGGVSCFRCLSNTAHRFVSRGGIVIGDPDRGKCQHDADHHAAKQRSG